ncbi:MAG: SDR family oxidoreductase [Clostridia bacterium]|nr:SDR family oxidoreductase [Clostridia bacterium]
MKNILITGASGDIGSAIAKKFAKKDVYLLLVYNKNFDAISKLKTELDAKCDVEIFKCNLTSADEINKMYAEIVEKFKHIDCLINCAGVSLIKQVQDTTEIDYNFVMDSNLKSTILLTSAVTKNMVHNGCGKIVNISSMWGKVGASMESLYSASKGAINSFTLSLAKELGPTGINVNAICPGLIDTKMNAHLTKADVAEIVASTPLNRIGKPEDVANLTYFLCSEEANFITGQIITIDGGLTL